MFCDEIISEVKNKCNYYNWNLTYQNRTTANSEIHENHWNSDGWDCWFYGYPNLSEELKNSWLKSLTEPILFLFSISVIKDFVIWWFLLTPSLPVNAMTNMRSNDFSLWFIEGDFYLRKRLNEDLSKPFIFRESALEEPL